MCKDDALLIDKLAEAFLCLCDIDECKAFFGDLFTAKELEDISSRLEVARLLKIGTNYNDIAAKTGASTATISRVSKCLSGELGGYRTVLARAAAASDEPAERIIRTDTLTDEEIAAVRAVVACFKAKK